VTSLHSTPWEVVCARVLIFPINTWAKKSPRAMIRSAIERAVIVLQYPVDQRRDHEDERLTNTSEIIMQHFAWQETAKLLSVNEP